MFIIIWDKENPPNLDHLGSKEILQSLLLLLPDPPSIPNFVWAAKWLLLQDSSMSLGLRQSLRLVKDTTEEIAAK